MKGSAEKAVAELRKGRRYPLYLLHGDEFLAKRGAKAILDAMVPPAHQSLCVETLPEDRELSSLPLRLRTLPFFGAVRVIVVYDTKAFVLRQSAETLARRSLEAWQAGETERAVRQFLQVAAALGETEGWIARAARGEATGLEMHRLLSPEHAPEAEAWLQEVSRAVLAAGLSIPEATGADVARLYEDTIGRGIPVTACLMLTTEVVDERRSLYRAMDRVGFIIDCGVRSKRSWDTQMSPEAARAKIREMTAAAGKRIDEETVVGIIQRTGSSMRGLVSELEKMLLYVGTRPAVTLADVRQVLSDSREANAFELTNAVSERDAGKALLALRSLMTQREPVLRILGVLAGELRNLVLARSVLDRRLEGALDCTMSFETFRVRMLPSLSQERSGEDGSAALLLRMNPFRAFNLLKGASRFSMAALIRGLESIAETDLKLKSSGQPEVLLMEQLLISLCAGNSHDLFR